MIPPQTQQVLDFLADPASYEHRPDKVELLQTHASWVFLASPYVYKLKKPVDFGFLNFTTLERRRANCHREVELNRRLAPDVYLGVETLTLGPNGFVWNGEGEVVEWLVKMREIDSDNFLSHRVREGRITHRDLECVVKRLVRFYRDQAPLSGDAAREAKSQLQQTIVSNLDAAASFVPDSLSAEALKALVAFRERYEAVHEAEFNARCDQGWFRDCHGDLHLEHILLCGDQVSIYDCIEFNDAFRQIDVACDIAFLAMDLDFHGLFAHATRLVQQFAEQLDDPGLLKFVDYYKCYRACVRGKVEALHAAGETAPQEERDTHRALSRRYFQLGLRYAIAGSAPTLFVFMGGVGAGKSTLASRFAAQTQFSVFSSDALRKQLAGAPLTQRGDAQQRATLYSAEMTDRVYGELTRSALDVLRRGECAILDATFSRRTQRDALAAAISAERVPIVWIEAVASPETVAARLQARDSTPGVISDARLEDLPQLQARYEPPRERAAGELIVQSTDVAPSDTLSELLTRLVDRGIELTRSKG